jgi:transcription elongation factor Elf1
MNTRIMRAYEEFKRMKNQTSIEEYAFIEKCPKCGVDNFRIDRQVNFDIYICRMCKERYDVKR